MSVQKLLEIVYSTAEEDWTERNKSGFESLFGSLGGRYPQAAKVQFSVRAPRMSADSGVPFAAYIHPSNPTSGAYSGLSFVMFPAPGRPCLLGFGVGTQGLAPDEAILGRPGHARKAQAICAWLNKQFGHGRRVAWAKQDPTRTEIPIPHEIKADWSAYKPALDRYEKELYALFLPTENRDATEAALVAFLDLLLEERGYLPLKESLANHETIRSSWFASLMPSVNRSQVAALLLSRRFVILQEPPGTGKTRMAIQLLRGDYERRGRTIQFHPNTTYENFIGGLAPDNTEGGVGLRFRPSRGLLMEAACQAANDPGHNYLLHIDEINRADLAKILGEAIFLLEAGTGGADSTADRRVDLPYDFGEPFSRSFYLPENLHILGTMNSADRSIAILDVAVRRRFAFVSLWPQVEVVQKYGSPLMQEAFRNLVSLFVEHASDDAFSLVPGHSYFIEPDVARAAQALQVNLAPLLQEYLSQGYVTGFAEPIRSYLQWLHSL